MAEAPTPEGSSTLSSFFSGNKRIPSMSFYGYLFSAVAVDIVLSDWLPGSGTAFVLCCRGLYMINGYKTDKMTTTTVATALVGVVPILADFSNIVFVISTYMTNVKETKPANDNAQNEGKSKTERMAAYGSSYLAARSVGAGLKGFAGEKSGEELSGAKQNQNTGYEQKNAPNDMRNAPTTAADKNTGYANNEQNKKSAAEQRGQERSAPYQNDKSVDGIARPKEEPAPRSIGYAQQPIFIKRPPQDASAQNDQNVGYQEAA